MFLHGAPAPRTPPSVLGALPHAPTTCAVGAFAGRLPHVPTEAFPCAPTTCAVDTFAGRLPPVPAGALPRAPTTCAVGAFAGRLPHVPAGAFPRAPTTCTVRGVASGLRPSRSPPKGASPPLETPKAGGRLLLTPSLHAPRRRERELHDPLHGSSHAASLEHSIEVWRKGVRRKPTLAPSAQRTTDYGLPTTDYAVRAPIGPSRLARLRVRRGRSLVRRPCRGVRSGEAGRDHAEEADDQLLQRVLQHAVRVVALA